MKVSCNGQSTTFLEKNPSYNSKTKHIDVQYHFIRDIVENNKVLLEKVDTMENIEDSSTHWKTSGRMLGCYILCNESIVEVNQLTVEVEVDRQQVKSRGKSTE
jgi:uncharacterized protein YacL (UPF0231 family)